MRQVERLQFPVSEERAKTVLRANTLSPLAGALRYLTPKGEAAMAGVIIGRHLRLCPLTPETNQARSWFQLRLRGRLKSPFEGRCALEYQIVPGPGKQVILLFGSCALALLLAAMATGTWLLLLVAAFPAVMAAVLASLYALTRGAEAAERATVDSWLARVQAQMSEGR